MKRSGSKKVRKDEMEKERSRLYSGGIRNCLRKKEKNINMWRAKACFFIFTLVKGRIHIIPRKLIKEVLLAGEGFIIAYLVMVTIIRSDPFIYQPGLMGSRPKP